MFLKNSLLFSRIFRQSISKRSIITFQLPTKLTINKNIYNLAGYFSKRFKHESNETSENDIDLEISDEDKKTYNELCKRIMHIPEMGHQVLIIQPYIKWGPNKTSSPKLKLEEAIALINTLPNWKVVDSMMFGLPHFLKPELFGKGNLEKLRDLIKRNKTITAVFISINTLKSAQQVELMHYFGVPIFDRYLIVMQIFKAHAMSQEAKLQVDLAEIPYLWSRIHENSLTTVGGMGETYVQLRRQILAEREKKLKRALVVLSQRRKLLRAQRHKLDHPIIAVVGYTNAGKTSLIKLLTGSEKLIPKNQLFATLDVTLHSGYLLNKLKVLYVDTIGFISDIPTNLIESFTVTLEDAMMADIIIHVRDISHPDSVNQSEKVLETLESFNLKKELLENMITVGNKIDLLKDDVDKFNKNELILMSTVTKSGLNELLTRIEQTVLKICDKIQITIRVPTGGEESRWLFKEAVVVDQKPDSNNLQYTFLNVIISNVSLNKFKHYFIKRR